MKTLNKILGCASLLVLAGAAGCGGEEEMMMMMPSDTGTCLGQSAVVVRGQITTDTTWTADKRYVLSGRVDVTNKATLTIQAGTTVCGDADQMMMNVSYLNVDQDAKLIADGTKASPIVFTSNRPAGMRKPQDWGGVVLRGHAPVNNPPSAGMGPETVCLDAEASAGKYGPCGTTKANDNSGTLRYVRIEFAGREFAPDKELNALSMYAVGSGTTLEYIQVHRGSDDGFEFFGGTANLKYAVASYCQDDLFDFEFGWVGKGQFWVGVQDLNIGGNGFEADNNRMNAALTPRTNPTISNVTLVGLGRGVTPGGSDKRQGLAFRSGVTGKYSNLIVTGFSDVGVFFEEATVAQAMAGSLTLTNSRFFNNGPAGDARNISDVTMVGATAFNVKSWVTGQAGNSEGDPMLVDPYSTTAPKWNLQNGSPALTGGTAPADGYFTSVPYVGAFGTEDWAAGWTAYPAN